MDMLPTHKKYNCLLMCSTTGKRTTLWFLSNYTQPHQAPTVFRTVTSYSISGWNKITQQKTMYDSTKQIKQNYVQNATKKQKQGETGFEFIAQTRITQKSQQGPVTYLLHHHKNQKGQPLNNSISIKPQYFIMQLAMLKHRHLHKHC